MKRLILAQSIALCGLTILTALGGCSDETPKPTPPPPDGGSGHCPQVGLCMFNGPEDDGNPCTFEQCDECGQTMHVPGQDGFTCALPLECFDLGTCQNGVCVAMPFPDGTPCTNMNPCAVNSVCMTGTCTPQSMVTCNADEFCSNGQCVGACKNMLWETPFSLTNQTAAMAIGDFNGDSRLDFILADSNSGFLVLVYNGDGLIFGTAQFDGGPHPISVVAQDFNGDGLVDVAVANESWNSVTIMLNSNLGSFNPNGLYPLGSRPVSMTTGDVNGDNAPDLVIGTDNESTHVLLNHGDGSFAADVAYPGGSVATIADLNGDGFPDLGVARLFASAIGTLLNNGDGTFAARVDHAIDVSSSSSITAADFDGDGFVDLATSSYNIDHVTIMRNQGNGTFAPAGSLFTGNQPWKVTASDINGDTHPDIIAVNDLLNTVDVFYNDGQGAFPKSRAVMTENQPSEAAVADYDGDGKPDIAIATRFNGIVHILVNECVAGP